MKKNNFLLSIALVIPMSHIHTGMTVGVQLVNYLNQEIELSNPFSSTPANFKCLYNSTWEDTNKNPVQLKIAGSTNGPVTSDWGYIEFDESVFSSCAYDNSQFITTLYGNSQPFADITFNVGNNDQSLPACNDSNNGVNCAQITFVPTDCPQPQANSFCYQIIVGVPPNQYCITNANTYDTASAMCISNSESGYDFQTILPGQTVCYETDPSITTDTPSIAANNLVSCDDGGCGDAACNITSLIPTISANTTTTIGCISDACKAADTLGAAPDYQVISTTQNSGGSSDAVKARIRRRQANKMEQDDQVKRELPIGNAPTQPETKDLDRSQEVKRKELADKSK